MKILLLGHKGYLGRYLHKKLDCDILDDRGVYSNNNTYDYVINCIGKPNLEYCEDHIEESYYSNCGVVKDIIKYYHTSKIINFSSYYVYDDFGLCNEKSQVTTKYNYCSQKLESESLITNGVTFRIGKLFGDLDLSQNKLTEYIINNDNLVLDEVLFNPTSLSQIEKVINYELQNNNLSGIYNLSNRGYVSHYEYGVFINKNLGGLRSVHKIGKHKRIFDNYGKFLMDTTKIDSIVGLTPWQNDMYDYLKKLQN